MKPTVLNRVIAKLVDLLIVFMVGAFLPRFIGPLLGFLYSVFADGIQFQGLRGQSLGKRLFGLAVVNSLTGKPAAFRESLIRNIPVGLATFFAIIPIWGWVILVLVGIPLMMMEIYLMIRVESQERLGDVMADTRVIVVPTRPTAV